MRYKLLFLVLVWSLPILADEEVRDSVKVKEVEVTASRNAHFSDGYQVEELSGLIKGNYSNETLGEALRHSSNVNIRSYGSPGASSSIAFRGLGASQTQVNWNGFPINSVTLGSADVSNITLTPGSTISLVPGAGGVSYGSGTFGGAVNVDYDTHNQQNVGVVDLTLGSFGRRKAAGSYNVNHKKLTFTGNIWGEQSEADYDYFDEIKQKELKRQNADYKQYGFQQYFRYKHSAYSELKGGIWGQAKDLNLPSIEGGSLKSYENQKDSTLRMFLSYKHVFNRSAIVAKGAWFYSDQRYVKKDSVDANDILIDSKIKSKTWFSDVNYRAYLTDRLSVDAGVSYNNTKGFVDAYQGDRKDEVLGLVGGIRYVNRISCNISVRKDWGNNVNSDFLLNTGVSYPIIIDRLMVRGVYSEKFRRPSFNDMFWVPGGNSNLEPEQGYSFETGLSYVTDFGKNGFFKTDVSGYYSPVNNMISWQPDGALWYVKNYSDVLTRGLDLKTNIRLDFKKVELYANSSLSYNKATIERIEEGDQSNVNKPLYYAPEWMANINGGVLTPSRFNVNVNWQFMSERFYDNSANTLKPYWLVDLSVAKTIKFDNQELFAQFSVENIFDERYQLVRAYPMPGRVWQIKLKYILN